MTKDGYHTWQYKEEDLDILKDPSVKAAFIVNPSNPPSYGLTDGLMKRIVDIVRNDNPNLMIITDDVYATYIPHFRRSWRNCRRTLSASILSPNISERQVGAWPLSRCMKRIYTTGC